MSGLKRQFVAGHGVKVKETTTTRRTSPQEGPYLSRFHTKGTYQFGSSGVIASDLTQWFDGRDLPPEMREMAEPTRTITLRKASYMSEGFFYDLPEGKRWLRSSGSFGPGMLVTQMINVLEPATLKGLLATATSTRRGVKLDGASTTMHKGTLTVARLYAVSPSFRVMYGGKPRGASAQLNIDWKLWQDAKQRTRKLVSTYTESDTSLHTSGRTAVTSTVTFSGWGAKTAITAPPAASVLDIEDWNPGEDMAAMPELSTPLPGRSR
ncbi:hypothetical protein Pve01_41130 [Planomonospora venezuelensis]|nr:hypothetical protein Pve01_41130 [Planomonospora venezuelensis]